MLEQVVERRRGDVGLDRHVGRRLVGDPGTTRLWITRGGMPITLAERRVERAADRPRRPGSAGSATLSARCSPACAAGASCASRPCASVRPSARSRRSSARRSSAAASRLPSAAASALRYSVGDLRLGVRDRVRQDLHDRRRARLDQHRGRCGRRCSPRGASILTLRTRFSRAWLTYSSPVSTCRNQRRKKMIANSTNATPPSTATRTASCGVIGGRRSSTGDGMCGRLRPAERAQAACRVRAAAAAARVVGQEAGEHAAADEVDGHREQRVEDRS